VQAKEETGEEETGDEGCEESAGEKGGGEKKAGQKTRQEVATPRPAWSGMTVRRVIPLHLIA